MAGITTAVLIGAGLAASAAGTVMQMRGQGMQTKALQKAERGRERQMNLEAMRRRREIIRSQIMAQSQATFAAFSQGAGFGSGLQGGKSQIAQEAGGQTLATNQNQSLGSDIFSANQQYYSASGVTNFGAGLSSLGGAVLQNAGTISRVGNYGAGKMTPTGVGHN